MNSNDSDISGSSIDGNLQDDESTRSSGLKDANTRYTTSQSPRVIREGSQLCIKVSEKENLYREKNFSDVKNVLEEKIICTTCGVDLAPEVQKGGDLNFHPHLKVLMCEECHEYYGEGNFSPDEDGSDQYCRWCGRGGSLYCCSKCACAFCKKCVKRNISKESRTALDDDLWECYVCQPEPIYHCRAVCYAAVECCRNKKRRDREGRRKKVKALAERKRSNTKPKRLDYSKLRGEKKSEGVDSDVEIIDGDSVNCSITKKDGISSKSKPSSSKKISSARKDTTMSSLKKLKSQSSGDLSDSDFEPKYSQRLKWIEEKKKRKSTESKSDSSKNENEKDYKSCRNSNSPNDKMVPSVPSTSKSTAYVLLDSLAIDLDNIAKVLLEKMSFVRKNYMSDKTCDRDTHSIISGEMLRMVKTSIHNLTSVEESLQKFNVGVQTGLGTASSSNQSGTAKGHRNGSTDADEMDWQFEQPLPESSPDDKTSLYATAKDFASESPENSTFPPDGKTISEVVDSGPDASETVLNESYDMFEDVSPMNSGTEDRVSSSKEKKSRGRRSSFETPTSQSHESMKLKKKLLASSSSASECEDVENSLGRHTHDSSNGSPIRKHRSETTGDHSDSNSELKSPTKRSSSSKHRFNIKDLDVYHSDVKLQNKCFVKVEKINEVEEKRLLDLVGDYYDADSSDASDSDRSVDNLTNLANLNRKVNGKEVNSKMTGNGKESNGKNGKKELKEEKKLADYLGESSELESSFENPQKSEIEKNVLSDVEKDLPDLPSLNEAKKNRLLQSSDSEAESSDIQTEDKSKAAKQPDLEKEESKQEIDDDVKMEENDDAAIKTGGDKDSEGENESKTKKKDWRKNKLLVGKLSDSDTSDDMRKIERLKSKKRSEDVSSDDNIIQHKNRKTKTPSKDVDSDVILNSDNSSSTSEDFVKKKRKILKKKSSSSSSSESDSKKKPAKKRRRIKIAHSSSSSDEDKAEKDAESPTKGRKKIRHVIREDELEEGTKNAAKEEEERRKRIADRQKVYDEIYDNIQKGFETLETLVLDFDENTKEPLIEVDKALVKKLKPHQAKGVKFMWDACFESLKRMKTSKGSGCILAHCMGLGKTFQVVTLVHTLFKYPATKVHTVLVVCPVSTVLNWVNEFHKWLQDVKGGNNIEVFELTKQKQNAERSFYLKQWMEDGGVMVIGYDMYRNLTNPEARRFRANIMKSFQSSLVDPGPDLVICDEGHLLKNEDTALSKAMSRIRTLRRVVLTGTPLQNNLKEYHCMVQFVKPNLLGTRKEFLNRFVNPITNGQFEDSTAHDVRKMKRRAHVLHKTLEGSVQRFDYSVLTPFLPSKDEFVISVRLSELQEKLYRHYLDNFSSRGAQGKGAQLFSDFQQLQRIWTHPRVLKMSAERQEKKDEKEEEEDSEGSLRDFIDDDDDSSSDSSSSSAKSSSDSEVVCLSDESKEGKKSSKNSTNHGRRTRSNTDILPDPEPVVPKREAAWWESFVKDSDFEDLRGSPKLSLLFSILKICEDNGEKLLVFSQSLFSLDVIEYFLSKIDDATQRGIKDETLDYHQGSWSPGIDYFRLDGSTPAETRSNWCKVFNKASNQKGRLFLISTKAGGLGINLVAANRVVIFDASWNPSHDVQSIFRVYRFGQKKPCFIYRFLAQGTMEEKIYERQVTKLSLACRVVDEQQIERYYKMSDLQELYNFTPADRSTHIIPKLPKDHLFAEILKKHEHLITTYHEHDSLLENKEEEELNEDERKAAWEDYESEKKGRINQGVPGFADALPTLEQIQDLLRVRHPEWTDEQRTAAAQLAMKQAIQQQYANQQRLMMLQQQQMQQQQQQRLLLALQQQGMNQPAGYPYGGYPMPNANFSGTRNLTSQVSITPSTSYAPNPAMQQFLGRPVQRPSHPTSNIMPSYTTPFNTKNP